MFVLQAPFDRVSFWVFEKVLAKKYFIDLVLSYVKFLIPSVEKYQFL